MKLPLKDIKPNSKMATYFSAQAIDGLRLCTLCLTQKPENEFSRQKSKFKNTGICRDCKKIKDQKDYRKHRHSRLEQVRRHQADDPIKYREINRLAVSRHRFGVDRGKLISDETSCEHCGITNEEHLATFSQSLHIHHKDGNGRHAQKAGLKPNNDPSNLQVLCVKCHTIEENKHQENKVVCPACGSKVDADKLN